MSCDMEGLLYYRVYQLSKVNILHQVTAPYSHVNLSEYNKACLTDPKRKTFAQG